MKQTFRRPMWAIAALALAIMMLVLGGHSVQAQNSQWLGEFWNNRNLNGPVAMTRWENSIDFNWFGGSPDPRINSDISRLAGLGRLTFRPAPIGFSRPWMTACESGLTTNWSLIPGLIAKSIP